MGAKKPIMSLYFDYSALYKSNFGFNCDKYPADCCAIFYGSEVISVFNFVVGACALSG